MGFPHVPGHSGVVFEGYAVVAVRHAALIGPMSVPMLFGLLPMFRHADAREAIGSILGGFAAFALTTYWLSASQEWRVLAPIATSVAVFSTMAWLNRGCPVPTPVAELLRGVSGDATRNFS